jgi:hypothetical protein
MKKRNMMLSAALVATLALGACGDADDDGTDDSVDGGVTTTLVPAETTIGG